MQENGQDNGQLANGREYPLRVYLTQEKGVSIMGGKTDIIKGRIEEATGVLAGNSKLRQKGKRDQAIGHAERVVEKAADRATQRLRT